LEVISNCVADHLKRARTISNCVADHLKRARTPTGVDEGNPGADGDARAGVQAVGGEPV